MKKLQYYRPLNRIGRAGEWVDCERPPTDEEVRVAAANQSGEFLMVDGQPTTLPFGPPRSRVHRVVEVNP